MPIIGHPALSPRWNTCPDRSTPVPKALAPVRGLPATSTTGCSSPTPSAVYLACTHATAVTLPHRSGVWIPADAEHEVVTSMQAEMRSLYVRRDACPWAPEQCRVLEVTPLARELIKQFCLFPADYPEDHSAESRLVAVLLDQLRTLPEVGFRCRCPATLGCWRCAMA